MTTQSFNDGPGNKLKGCSEQLTNRRADGLFQHIVEVVQVVRASQSTPQAESMSDQGSFSQMRNAKPHDNIPNHILCPLGRIGTELSLELSRSHLIEIRARGDLLAHFRNLLDDHQRTGRRRWRILRKTIII